MRPRTYKKLIRQVVGEVLNWYCHSNTPPPAWWRTTGPYNTVLEGLGEK